MLEEVKGLSQEELNDIIGRRQTFNDDWPKEEVVRVLEGFLNETPENSCYVRFAWL
jgi:hypothetical protein